MNSPPKSGTLFVLSILLFAMAVFAVFAYYYFSTARTVNAIEVLSSPASPASTLAFASPKPLDPLPDPKSITPAPRAQVSSAHPKDLSHGMLSFNFDDGFVSAYNVAFPMLEQAGFASTEYIITRAAIGHSQYMTWQDVFNLAAEGNEIGAHTRTHVQLTTVSLQAAENEILGSKQDLESLGFHITTFAYPQGYFNAGIESIVEQAGFKGARITQPLLNDPSSDLFALKRQRIEMDTTWPEIKTAIDQAIAQHKWVILVMHRIDESSADQVNAPSSLLAQTIDYVKQTGIPVVTNDVGIDVLKSATSAKQ